MSVKCFSVCLVLWAYLVFIYFPHHADAAARALEGGGGSVVPVSDGPTVRKDERWPVVSSEFGEISGVKIRDGENGCYYLHFITMNPRSLFLPVYLHSEMLLYVNSGSGTLSWIKDGHKLQELLLKRGDIYRLPAETIFYLQNNVNSYDYQSQNLQIYAIFPGSEVHLQNDQFAEAYTGVNDLLLGFDNRVLQSTLGVPEEVIEELRGGGEQPLIVEGQPEVDTSMEDIASWGMRAILGTRNNRIFDVENKMKAYNIFSQKHDVETCYGWSSTVTSKDLDVFKHTDFGVFMVNLTTGSMMGPHWNPSTTEVSIVLHGQGVIEVICPGLAGEMECKSSRLSVTEGDVFVVPRYYPMAQMSFNNDSLVFMGFMLKQKNERPQYLAEKLSMLEKIDRNVLEKSFNVKNTTIDWILSNPKEDIIYECISCAEESIERGGGGEGWTEEEEEGGGGWRKEKHEGGGRWEEGERGGGGWPEDKGGRGGAGGGWEEPGRGGGEGGGWKEEGRSGEGEWKEEGRGRGGWKEQGGGGWQDQGRGGGGGWQEEGRGGGWQEQGGS